jgi:hypothetical protein
MVSFARLLTSPVVRNDDEGMGFIPKKSRASSTADVIVLLKGRTFALM